MATKLNNLKIKKVDFVDEGANPEADILIYKNAEGNPNVPDKPEEGVLKKLITAIGKILKAKPEEIETVMKDLETDANEPIVENREPEMKGEESVIDKNLMTPAEKAFYEDIEKRCSSAQAKETHVNGLEDNPITKAAEKTEEAGTRDEEDLYKGLHPVVAAELKELRKRADAAEEKELLQIAKKYEVIGKKPEELVPMLKNLKHTDESAYNDTISILDATVSAVNKSGIFDEFGKSGHSSTCVNSVETKISGIAKGYIEKNPSMSYEAAVAKAWEDNQDLINEYEEEAGF